jgi:hypothetical protein
VSITWPVALGWRLRQQLLDPVGTESVAGVVRRLGALPAQSPEAVVVAVRGRRRTWKKDDVDRALAAGEVIRTFAFRGATHLMTPQEGSVFLALRAAGRMWERKSWQTFYDLRPDDWPDFRAAVREALADGPLTREELGATITAHARYRHLGFAFEDQSLTLLKPLGWLGDMSIAPPKDGRLTFQGLSDNPHWTGLPDLDDAGVRAIELYLAAYGPTTPGHVQYFLGEGLGAGRARIQRWLTAMTDRLATVDVDGEPAVVLREHLADLERAAPSRAVRFLPGHDQWVMGAGTKDRHVVPPAQRGAVTRGANVVVAGGVVSGTWSVKGDDLLVTWSPQAGAVPDLDEEAARLAAILDRPELTVRTA